LNQSLKEVAASSDLGEIFSETLKIIRENEKISMAAVLIFDIQGELQMVDSFGWEEDWLNRYQSYPLGKYSLTLAPILVFKKPLICVDIRKHNELMQTFAGTGIKSIFAYPLVIKDELVGAILIADHQSTTISEEDSQILESITHQAGIALQNAITIGEEKQKADTDGLTGLFNRRYFNEKIEELVKEVQYHPGFLSLIMTDVDNFKKYNDFWGHAKGDECLIKIAKSLNSIRRSNEDVFGRYGGEEFVYFAVGINYNETVELGNMLKNQVEKLCIKYTSDDESKLVTISLGGSLGKASDFSSTAEILQIADKELYKSKRMGRNIVNVNVL
jgi:diguanylate cyclase (GGDEF)-like protein